MMYSNVNLERLQRVLDVQRSKDWSDRTFLFDSYNVDLVQDGSYKGMVKQHTGKRHSCAGCVIGDMPVISSKWEYNDYGVPQLVGSEGSNPNDDGCEYFGLTHDQYDHLFVPGLQNVNRYGGKPLTRHSERDEVLDNMEAFIKMITEYKTKHGIS